MSILVKCALRQVKVSNSSVVKSQGVLYSIKPFSVVILKIIVLSIRQDKNIHPTWLLEFHQNQRVSGKNQILLQRHRMWNLCLRSRYIWLKVTKYKNLDSLSPILAFDVKPYYNYWYRRQEHLIDPCSYSVINIISRKLL